MEQSHSQNPTTVLVVEDEPFIRLDALDMIKEAGFRTYEAGGAEEAIRLLEEHADIGILFTDVNMPGSMNGLELARSVRDRWPPVKIIIASGQMTLRNEDMPRESVFFSKPYRARQIVGKLREMAAEGLGH
ncbi:response regulator [Methylocapsa sp. S129]|uniref:response regulator n=1 Tax=Methylocapsa sp. S129 TaxID=1641869 RepID=UPI00131EAE7D|nr:response regulator [Methylocapsa sp. S129]